MRSNFVVWSDWFGVRVKLLLKLLKSGDWVIEKENQKNIMKDPLSLSPPIEIQLTRKANHRNPPKSKRKFI